MLERGSKIKMIQNLKRSVEMIGWGGGGGISAEDLKVCLCMGEVKKS